MHKLVDEAYAKHKPAFDGILEYSGPPASEGRTYADNGDDLYDSAEPTEPRLSIRTNASRTVRKGIKACGEEHNHGLDGSFADASRHLAFLDPQRHLLRTSSRPQRDRLGVTVVAAGPFLSISKRRPRERSAQSHLLSLHLHAMPAFWMVAESGKVSTIAVVQRRSGVVGRRTRQ